MKTDKEFFDTWAKDYDNHNPKVPQYNEIVNVIKSKLSFSEDSRVLDIGIGTGFVAFSIMKDKKCVMYGIDISDEMLKKAKEKADKLGFNVELKRENAKDLDFPENFFDAIVSVYTLHHLDDSKGEKLECLRRIYKSLKKGGVFVEGDMFIETEEMGEERFREVTNRWASKSQIAFKHAGEDAGVLELKHASLVYLKDGEYMIPVKKWEEYMTKVGFKNIGSKIIDDKTSDFVIWGEK